MTLSINRWVGVTGDFGAANNWSQGSIPFTDDVAVFDGSSQQSVTSGLSAGGSPFGQLLVKPSYRGNVGSPGDPLRVDLGTGVIVWRGRGQAYIAPDTTANVNVICDTEPSQRDSLILGGIGAATYIENLAVKGGRCRVIGDVALGVGIYVLSDTAHLICDPNLAAYQDPVRITCNAGRFENSRSISSTASRTFLVGDRSRVRQLTALPSNCHVIVSGNARFAYVPTSEPGTSPTLSLVGGTLDQSEEQFDSVWGAVYIGPDAQVIGGTVRGSGVYPPDLDFRLDYPGAEE